MTHRSDSGRGLRGRRGRRRAARPIEPAEAQFAAEVSRLPGRLGLPFELDGFLAWRVYTGVRALWRLWRRVVTRVERR